uniref:Uncharacterized protein n=1 Tax=Heterorhabditis bacteriophora TaxID=37862 RepID=A0A1I7XC31_HETBA
MSVGNRVKARSFEVDINSIAQVNNHIENMQFLQICYNCVPLILVICVLALRVYIDCATARVLSYIHKPMPLSTNGVNFFNPTEDEENGSSTSSPQPAHSKAIDVLESLNNCSLKSVDSEVFDNGPFRPSYAIGSYVDHGTSPYEISSTPIEVNESRKHRTIEISNRARLESQNDTLCLSPKSAGVPEEMEPRCKSPQLVEMHTFRDAIDVNYQRMAITGEELSGVCYSFSDYSQSSFFDTICHSTIVKGFYIIYYYSDKWKKPEWFEQFKEFAANTSFNPPEPPKDHWGLEQELPKFDVKYILKRNNGVVDVCSEDGNVDPKFAKFYITKEQFLTDTERLTQMIVDGPL